MHSLVAERWTQKQEIPGSNTLRRFTRIFLNLIRISQTLCALKVMLYFSTQHIFINV